MELTISALFKDTTITTTIVCVCTTVPRVLGTYGGKLSQFALVSWLVTHAFLSFFYSFFYRNK